MTFLCGGSPSKSEQERRAAERHILVSSATVYRAGERHLGVVRDLSQDGLFVFSHFLPDIGECVRVEVDRSPHDRIAFTGSVIRIEVEAACGTTGIAITFDSRFL
jgi:PilZ domain